MIMSDEAMRFLSAAWEAASTAGTLVRECWQQPKEIQYKNPIDLVTSVDRESEQRIVEVLHRAFPGHSILAEEETEVTGSQSSYRWIIDPLDGTTNFAHSYPHFAISIALELEGEVFLGLVYDPLREECFRAIKERGATLNGSRIRISATRELDKSLLATGFPYDRRDRPDDYLEFFTAFLVRTQGIRRNGSAALDLCYVACGRLDGFWEAKLHPWDTAAGSLMVREAGGTLSDFSGNKFSIWEDETLASNGAIHAEMVSVATAAASRLSR
jgi:myo-inositol-1(or 4)-monophosphatase